MLVLLVAKLAPRRLVGRAVGVVIALISVASLAWCIEQTSQAATQAYFSPFTRAWELGVGALLAAGSGWLLRLPAVVGRWLGWLGLAAVIGSAFWITDATPFPGAYALLPVLGTAAVVAAGSIAPGVGAESVLRQRPLQWLGAMSYSLYLWHWPALVIAAALVGGTLGVGPALLVVLASLLVAVLTHHAVENPLRRAPRLAARTSNSLGFGVLALVTVLFACNVMISNQAHRARRRGGPGAGPAGQRLARRGPGGRRQGQRRAGGRGRGGRGEAPAERRLAPARRACPSTRRRPTSTAAWCRPRRPGSPSCTYGDTSASKTVVLFGDSHAAAWLSALDAAGEREHFKPAGAHQVAVPVPVDDRLEHRRQAAVQPVRRLALLGPRPHRRRRAVARRRVEHDVRRPAAVVAEGPDRPRRRLAARRDHHPEAARRVREARGRARRLAGDGRRPRPVPRRPPQAGAALLAADARGPRLSREVLQAHVAKVAKADYLPVVDWFCTPTECPMVVKGVVTHYDRWHLTADYRLAAEQAARLGPAAHLIRFLLGPRRRLESVVEPRGSGARRLNG
ncbi:hypothetical protein GCM10025868_20050 [Angustibacter aerolatus]|uniref:SGNH domain-containing protein n=1 Tax=Angustibacter aerolatus TaxID=1162965 RepID=A0ABQ6JIV0_9ACTN|nr:acyltransferase family protein [Angustibacter aerolatus]GMA86755.1 hypothetical protein GCM10025868_20050 [Angustibacter aerolatus]